MPILEIKNLIKKYHTKNVIDNISLNVDSGKIVGLLGPNGSGKTTLIKLLAGLLTATSGDILIDNKEIGIETKAIVSFLPDRPYFANWMKVHDILAFFADFYRDFSMKKATEMLKLLNIGVNDRIKTMSKGTKEKLNLVLVMSRTARLYLLDEPIAGVDPAARDYILRTIISNYSEDSSVIITTHHIADVEKILDDVIFLNEGKIELNSAVEDLREEYGKSVDEIFRETYICLGGII
ncbi:ABC transporter ATP-binding protein [Pseudoruminococcus massiliensis]|uniref:ABC transporter ATP-binding protein n=1 Tax=Pseudoruminococcus massiliensis TaxID=2086583 RepID=UPI003AB808D0